MSEQNELFDLLALRPMPEVAHALRAMKETILQRWQLAVGRLLPDADPLTAKQVRDTIPSVIDQLAKALESSNKEATDIFREITTNHGSSRFHQAYNVHELIVEYRLLRRIIVEEVNSALSGGLNLTQTMALDMGVDIALQQSVVEFVAHLRRELGAAAEAQSKYMAFLSHDLRNNLNAILLAMELVSMRLRKEPTFSQEVEDITRLRRSVSDTVDGMDRLLQAERLRKSTTLPRWLNVDLSEILHDVANQHQPRASEKGLRIEVSTPAQAIAQSDRELIKLVVQNLLGNAVKYSQRGVVTLGAAQRDGRWMVWVSDQGPGIAPDRLGQLFQAFSRGETHGQPGMGLGLSIAAEAARALGASITVESEVGKGSVFSLQLPEGIPGG